MPTALQGRAQKAKSQKPYQFRNLYGMLNADVLRDCWRAIKKNAAYGVDRVSAQEYAHNLEDNLKHLVERLKRKSSRAKLVRRHSIPKGGGKVRPLGMPVVEEKLVQLAVTRLLTAIDEQDCLRWSSGYRPHVGALDAVDALTIKLQCGRANWVVEADITGCFDHIDHEWLLRMLAERIDDRALIRLIKKWLKAGGLDTDGTVRHPATGSPQGGVVSPILAKVSLHYARDLWFEKVVKRHGHGEACLIRSADDYVGAFEHRDDAERFSTVRGQRVRKFGLELSGEKTRMLPCSRHPAAAPTRCECLGCEFQWGKDRAGQEHLKRRPSRQKVRNSLKRFTAWWKEHRHLRLRVLFEQRNITLRGYYNYDGVHGNTASLHQFFHSARRILMKWLNRRSQRRGYNWHGYRAVLRHCKVARPRIVERLRPKKAIPMA